MNLDLARSLVEQLSQALKPNTVIRTAEAIQPAINAALPGDTIDLALNVYTVGMLHLPPKDAPGVRLTSTQGVLLDGRVNPEVSPLMALLRSGNPDRTIDATGSANWIIDGIAFQSSTDGHSDVIRLQDAQNITLDRILLVAGPQGQKRGICANGTNIRITRSYLANLFTPGQDSQAICFWDGAGPYHIEDNYTEAAGENLMVGGADSKSPDKLPSDIRIIGNTFTKNPDWKGKGYAVKNLLEFKVGKRIVILGNDFSQCWPDAQTGYGILFKSVNQNGTAPWSSTEDVLFEGNTITDVAHGFNIQGETFEKNPDGSSQHGGKTKNVTIRGNTVNTAGVAVQITGAPGPIILDRTTFVNGYTFLQLGGAPIETLTVTGVLANHNAYGVKGDGSGIGTPSLTKFATAYTWANNVLIGGAGKGTYPPTTYFDLASVPAGVLVGR